MITSSLRPPLLDTLIDSKGFATRTLQNWLNSVSTAINGSGPFLSLTQFGTAGNGADDTGVFQAAINQAVANRGGIIFIPAGAYSINTVTIPRGTSPITFYGCGAATVINRRGNLAAGKGLFDVFGSNVSFQSLVIDGQVLTSVGLLYNADFATTMGLNDPMAPSLTANTLVWAHGPLTDLSFDRVTFRHSSGYAPLVDAGSGAIWYVSLTNCKWENCRPNLFGVDAGNAIFGSWTGGLYINGDGRTVNPGSVLHHLLVTGCSWTRVNGNAVWSHLYGLDELHEDFRITANSFEDCGLDGVEIGGVIGGCVADNVFHRIGYTTENDNDLPTPRWLPNLNATAIDSAGLVISVPFSGNSIISPNGGAIDTDSHGQSSVTCNVIRIPIPGEIGYDEDRIAISGISNNGSTSYGYNGNNSQNQPLGADSMNITGNTFINLRLGAIRMFATRRTVVEANTVIAPADSLYPPISMGPVGPGPYQRCHSNRITHNKISYEPATAAPVVFEDPTYSAFLPSESNAVFGQQPITPDGTPAFEFQKAPTSGSVAYGSQVWFP